MDKVDVLIKTLAELKEELAKGAKKASHSLEEHPPVLSEKDTLKLVKEELKCSANGQWEIKKADDNSNVIPIRPNIGKNTSTPAAQPPAAQPPAAQPPAAQPPAAQPPAMKLPAAGNNISDLINYAGWKYVAKAIHTHALTYHQDEFGLLGREFADEFHPHLSNEQQKTLANYMENMHWKHFNNFLKQNGYKNDEEFGRLAESSDPEVKNLTQSKMDDYLSHIEKDVHSHAILKKPFKP